MKRAMILAATVLVVALNSSGQIVITAPEVPHTIGGQFQYYVQGDCVLVNVGSPGGPQVWDFTQGDTANVATDLYLDPALSPPEYSRANVVIQSDQLNMFGLTDPGILYCWLGATRYILGAATTVYAGTPLAIEFSPYVNQLVLPLELNRTWTNQINLDEIYELPDYDIRVELSATMNHNADAYGTTLVPLGSYETLRIRTDISYDLTVSIRFLFIWIPILTESGSSVSYEWRAENVGMVANVIADAPGSGLIYAEGQRQLMGASAVAGEALAATPMATTAADVAVISGYPNPFNAQTTLSYALAQGADVDLRIFDLMGRQVAQWEQGWRDAGSHAVIWSPEHLSAGVYVVQLRAGNQLQRQTMVYLK